MMKHCQGPRCMSGVQSFKESWIQVRNMPQTLTFHSKNISNSRIMAPAQAERTTIQRGTISGFSGASVGTTSVMTSSVRRLT
jgi:hypothetical protein